MDKINVEFISSALAVSDWKVVNINFQQYTHSLCQINVDLLT